MSVTYATARFACCGDMPIALTAVKIVDNYPPWGYSTRMPKPRGQIVSLAATAYYHCINRCVRRLLVRPRPLYRANFDHRKQWLVERMKELAAIFAIDICAYGVLSNHFHVILHVDHERACGWTNEQVAERYAKLFPHTERTARLLPENARAKTLAEWRRRLWI